MVARLDGRSFGHLTNELEYSKPFSGHFRDLMVRTASELVQNSGFRILFGYTHSDEISLLLDRRDDTFGRKLRKINSTLAGLASAVFTYHLGVRPVSFDCRVSWLPTVELVQDYFRWRQADAERNALHGHCYWLLRRQRLSRKAATSRLQGRSVAYKHNLLYAYEMNYNDLPDWQKRGIGIRWHTVDHKGQDPRTGEVHTTQRRKLWADVSLPYGQDIGDLITDIVTSAEQ